MPLLGTVPLCHTDLTSFIALLKPFRCWLRKNQMTSHFHFAVAASYLAVAVIIMLWVMLSGFVAARLEKDGIAFRSAFLICAFLTPLAGIITVRMMRALKAERPLTPTTLRS